MMRRAVEYWERRQELADRCACGGSPMYRKALTSDSLSTHGFFGQKLPIPSSSVDSSQLEALPQPPPDRHYQARRAR